MSQAAVKQKRNRPCRPIAERLWARVAKAGPDECWEWSGNRMPNGHGRISLGRASEGSTGAHRIAWQLTNGPIPDGLVVRHTCDNPPCCNPAHLLIGTQGDNVRDAVARGRIAREFRKPQTRLSDEDVRAIRATFWRQGHRTNSAELAAQYGVGRDYITAIARGVHRRSA